MVVGRIKKIARSLPTLCFGQGGRMIKRSKYEEQCLARRLSKESRKREKEGQVRPELNTHNIERRLSQVSLEGWGRVSVRHVANNPSLGSNRKGHRLKRKQKSFTVKGKACSNPKKIAIGLATKKVLEEPGILFGGENIEIGIPNVVRSSQSVRKGTSEKRCCKRGLAGWSVSP